MRYTLTQISSYLVYGHKQTNKTSFLKLISIFSCNNIYGLIIKSCNRDMIEKKWKQAVDYP